MRVGSAAGTYLRRFRPDAELIGVEHPVGAGIADLVWHAGDQIVIDEVKLGSCDLSDSRLIAQVTRFLAGAPAEFGDGFIGVRLVPLSRPCAARLIVGTLDGRLVPALSVPSWLEVK